MAQQPNYRSQTMKKTMAVAVIVMATLTVNAQQAGGKNGNANGGGPGAGGPGAQGGQQHQRPSPEQMAEQLMNKFDANKDGKLDEGELTQALTALRAHRPPQGGGQGGQGQGGGAALGGQSGQQHHGPAGGGEAGSGAQGGQGGQHHGLAGGNGQQGAGQGSAGAVGERPTPPPANEVAAKMIEKFAADKKGLTQSELATALADRHKNHGPHDGPGGQHGGGAQGGAGATKQSN
jgi:hypothetical protein